MTETHQVNFHTAVDLEVEKGALRAFYADYIAADRVLPPRVTFYRDKEPTISVTSRIFDPVNIKDRNRCIMDMLYLVPAVMPTLAIVTLQDPVHLVDGIEDSLIMIACNKTGAFAEVFPWNIDDNGKVQYREDAALSLQSDGAYSSVIAHMLPVFFTAKDTPFMPSDLLQYLSSRGFEVNLYGDWTVENINSKCDLFV